MNVFLNPDVADVYDDYYQTDTGKKVNKIETALMEEALAPLQKGSMLELGCGTGHWTEFFCKKGFEVTAADCSEAMLKHARAKNTCAKFINADAADLPFPNHSFEAVTSVTMLEFVPDVDQVLAEIDRVLAPGGWLVLACLNGNSALAKNASEDPVFREARFFTPESLTQKLARFGKAELFSGVHFSPDFEVMDATRECINYEPAFLLARVQKK